MLTKPPVPVPSVVLLLLMVGFEVVAQHTPLAVTIPPPLDEIVPPPVAAIAVMEDMADVESVGKVAKVLKDTSFPYTVPALFEAKALT